MITGYVDEMLCFARTEQTQMVGDIVNAQDECKRVLEEEAGFSSSSNPTFSEFQDLINTCNSSTDGKYGNGDESQILIPKRPRQTQQAHSVKMTSYQRRCDVISVKMTSDRRQSDVMTSHRR